MTNRTRTVIEKAKYKRNNSTRRIAKSLQSHNIKVSNTTVWRYLTNKGRKAFKRKKIPLLSEKQRMARLRLRFARKYYKLTAEDGEDVLFTDECPKYLFQIPESKKRYRMGLSGVRLFPSILGEAKCKGNGMWRYEGSWPDKVTHFT